MTPAAALAEAARVHEEIRQLTETARSLFAEVPPGPDGTDWPEGYDLLADIMLSAEKMLADTVGGTGCHLMTAEAIAQRTAALAAA